MAKNKFAKQFSGVVAYNVEELKDGTTIDLAELFTEENFIAAKPCLPSQLFTIGSAPVIKGNIVEELNEETGEVEVLEVGSSWVETLGDSQLIRVGISQKKVSKKEIKKLVDAKVKVILENVEKTGIPLENSLKDIKKDLAVVAELELAPNFYSEEIEVLVWFDNKASKLFVAVPTYKKAEIITEFLRSRLGTLPIYPLSVNNDVVESLTKFVTDGIDNVINLGGNLVAKCDKETLTITSPSLAGSDAAEIIKENGFEVIKLGLECDGVISFTTNADLEFSSIKYDSVVTSESDDELGTFILCYSEIKKAFSELIAELGGEFVYNKEEEEIDEEEFA